MDSRRQVTNRLVRSTGAKYRTIDDITAFCDAQDPPIKYSKSAESIDKIANTDALKRDFNTNFVLEQLPPTSLKEEGTSPVLVFEPKIIPNGTNVLSNHGELCAAISRYVGHSLVPGVDAIYLHKSVNPNFLTKVEHDGQANEIKELVKNQGVPVINTSVGWQDKWLNYENADNAEQANHLWQVTAFLVDSAGNDGRFGTDGKTIGPEQKHNALSHFAPLSVHVGAAEGGKNTGWVIPGYSSANSPTFIAPASATLNVHWREDDKLEPAIGTSTAAPYASGVLAALNNRYGSYLTREQILYAVIATCTPVEKVTKFVDTDDEGKDRYKTPEDKFLTYKQNKNGFAYNPEYGGFGLIHPHKADHLLCHMVSMAQSYPDGVSVPTEDLVHIVDCSKVVIPGKDSGGHDIYQYKVHCQPGIALKTTIEADFAKEHGNISITSPSGTTVPMVMSKLRDEKTGNIMSSFSLSTSHAWAGEQTGGEWTISSSTPLNRLRLNQDHFLSNDIVKYIDKNDVDRLLTRPAPYMNLANAIPLAERIPELIRVGHERIVPKHRTTVGTYNIADTNNTGNFINQLSQIKSGFEFNFSPAFTIPSFWPDSPEGTFENVATRLNNALDRDVGSDQERDEIRHAIIYNRLAAVDIYNAQGHREKTIIPLCSAAAHSLACTNPFNEKGESNSNNAIKYYKRALGISEELGFYDKAYEIAGKLHNTISLLCQGYHYDEYAPQLAETRKKILELSKIVHGYDSTIDNSAVRVGKGEYRISNGEKLGSYNTSDSMSIVAHDSETGKTGLLHLADDSPVQLVEDFFSQFGDKPLELKLIGVRAGHQALATYQSVMAQRSDDIVSADMRHQNDMPRAVVVDPVSRKLEEKIAGNSLDTEISVDALQYETPYCRNFQRSRSTG